MKEFGRRRKFAAFLTLLSLVVSVVVVHLRIFKSDDSSIGSDGTKSSNDLRSSVRLPAKQKTKPPSSANPRLMDQLPAKKLDDVKPSNISIYLSDASSVHSMDLNLLTSIWDHSTTYENLLELASDHDLPLSAPAKEALRRELQGKNVTVIFHTIPKTASSTLRKACMETQFHTCNIPLKPAKDTWPDGYRTPVRLTQLFSQCPETRHFCLRHGFPITTNFTRFYDSRTFLHLFPFRNYDEWSKSALHQISYRDGEEGCEQTDGYLDECLPHQKRRISELDLRKYTKSDIVAFVQRFEGVRKRMKNRDVRGHHRILMHNYLHLDGLMPFLHDAFGVPLLPGTDRRVNSVRPNESCKEEDKILRKFHDCFDAKLAELH
ncbi:hypothetical protein ACHAWF_008042 [Thalassiosira exigua]